MLAKDLTIAALLLALLSTGAPLDAYCPTVGQGSCPTSESCEYDTSYCAPAYGCNPWGRPYCYYDLYICVGHNQICTRGCICW